MFFDLLFLASESCIDPLLFCLSLLDLLFLLLQELCRNASIILLGATQQVPQLHLKDASILGVEEARQVDLHVLSIWEPCIQLIIHKFYDDIIFHPQKFCDT